MEHQVYGNGYHCLMKKHILVTSMSFWGEKFESLRTEPVKLTNDECNIMVITKKCRESPMNCDAEYCTYSANPKATFSWLNERKNSDILISESHLAVQASGIQIICNVSVLTTVEGIYLSRKTNQDINNK
ncbi:hypothetical protein BpHYR1_021501, partial [Brachionus plicatilis]